MLVKWMEMGTTPPSLSATGLAATPTFLLLDAGKNGERQSILLTSTSTWLAYYESISTFGELCQRIGRKWVQLHHSHPPHAQLPPQTTCYWLMERMGQSHQCY